MSDVNLTVDEREALSVALNADWDDSCCDRMDHTVAVFKKIIAARVAGAWEEGYWAAVGDNFRLASEIQPNPYRGEF